MKQIQFYQTGSPADVVRCGEAPAPTLSAADDVLVRVEAFPINPADLLTLQGYYPRNDPLSPTLGIEAVGIVELVGPAVSDVTVGHRVILLSRDNWSEIKRVKAHEIAPVSAALDPLLLASLKVNPATAMLLLRRFVDLRPGDWLIQNAANSSVGRIVVQLARHAGLRTINVVRRADVAPDLLALGADAVLLDGDDLPVRAKAIAAGAPIRLALDSVAGTASNRLASTLAHGGTLVVFGAMSGEAITLHPTLPVFHDLRVRGFWLTPTLDALPRADVLALYDELQRLMISGALRLNVGATFQVSDIRTAMQRASAGGGKVVVTF